MRDALKTIPGVEQVTVGVVNAKSWAEVDSPVWVHAFIDYRYTEKDGKWQGLRFEAHGRSDQYFFQVVLGGIYSPDEKGPPTWGTENVIDIWKERCSVSAVAFFV
jgi:hypothetical protein